MAYIAQGIGVHEAPNNLWKISGMGPSGQMDLQQRVAQNYINIGKGLINEDCISDLTLAIDLLSQLSGLSGHACKGLPFGKRTHLKLGE